MKIANRYYKILNELETLNVPDCFVIGKHKLGKGHGERKFYVSNKKTMNSLQPISLILSITAEVFAVPYL